MNDACPCGSGLRLADCCGPLVFDGVPADTAEQLMRSRYTAFALGRPDHLWRSWHPRTRPSAVDSSGPEWTGLTVLGTHGGGPDRDTGTVEFRARYRDADGPGEMHERSRFVRRGGRWFYLDAEPEDGASG